jgi:hypothetical protein
MVSGFVPIPGHPRPEEIYQLLGSQLVECQSDKIMPRLALRDCWMWPLAGLVAGRAEGDNPAKNTLAYHTVQHEKVSFLCRAAACFPNYDAYVWVDRGIFSLPGITAAVIDDFMARIRPDALAIPGCWTLDTARAGAPDLDCDISWRFCGSVLVCPRSLLPALDATIRAVATIHAMRRNKITWEVNTWARLEQENILPIRWYQADHNETMFTNY